MKYLIQSRDSQGQVCVLSQDWNFGQNLMTRAREISELVSCVIEVRRLEPNAGGNHNSVLAVKFKDGEEVK